MHTGVKSAGCENSTPQLSPSHSWKLMRPVAGVLLEVGGDVAESQCHVGSPRIRLAGEGTGNDSEYRAPEASSRLRTYRYSRAPTAVLLLCTKSMTKMADSPVTSHPMISLGTPLSPTATRVMLLGCGELGKEVLIELQRLGVETIAVDRYANAPGQQVAHRAHVIAMTRRRRRCAR